MPDLDIGGFVDQIIRDSRIPRRRQRDELRRELLAHFEDAGESPEAQADALRRFGDPSAVTAAWRRAYRLEYLLVYCAKIATSIAASVAGTLFIEVVANLRVGVEAEVWRLAPGFSHAAALAVGIVVGLVAIREAIRPPFDLRHALPIAFVYAAVCGGASLLLTHSLSGFLTATALATLGCLSATVATRTGQALLTLAAFAAAEYALHWLLRVDFGPGRALAAGAVLVAVWASTLGIIARVDRMFFTASTTV